MTVEVISSMTSEVLLSDLRLLAHAVDLGSFASVARAMHLPKTSVTRQIQRLEAAAGYRLLHRGNGNFALTEEGRELLSKVRGPLNAIDEAMVQLTANAGLLQGRLRVTAPYNYGRTVIAPALASFMTLHPAIEITLELSSRKVDFLADEADIAIRVGAPGSDQLIARRLTGVQVILCASPDYLAKSAPISSLADLLFHRLLDFRPETAHFELCDAHGHKQRLAPVRIALRSNEPEVLTIAAMQGAGIAIMPEHFARESVACASLAVVLPGCGLPMLDMHALYAPGRRQSKKIRAFLDYIVTHSLE